MNGTIKTLNAERGFGFIRATDGKEYFFHRSGLDGISVHDLAEGDPVTFEEEASERGPRATKITRFVKAATPAGG